jgi:hypothetical protein
MAALAQRGLIELKAAPSTDAELDLELDIDLSQL